MTIPPPRHRRRRFDHLEFILSIARRGSLAVISFWLFCVFFWYCVLRRCGNERFAVLSCHKSGRKNGLQSGPRNQLSSGRENRLTWLELTPSGRLLQHFARHPTILQAGVHYCRGGVCLAGAFPGRSHGERVQEKKKEGRPPCAVPCPLEQQARKSPSRRPTLKTAVALKGEVLEGELGRGRSPH